VGLEVEVLNLVALEAEAVVHQDKVIVEGQDMNQVLAEEVVEQ
jgi:hypothetical protein